MPTEIPVNPFLILHAEENFRPDKERMCGVLPLNTWGVNEHFRPTSGAILNEETILLRQEP